MSNPLNNFQEYFREIEAEMEALKAAVLAKEEASKPLPPSAEASTIGAIPVMHFQGPVEPFTLTVRQLETVRACWSDVQGFLWVNAGTPKSSQAQPEPVHQPPRPTRTRETRVPRGWAAERAAALGVSPIPNPNAPQNGGHEVDSNSSEPEDDEETGPGRESPFMEDQEIHGEDLPMRERPNYGISRIDQPEKANHGWYVRITKKGHTEQKFFADKSYGGRDQALENAREFRDYLKVQILGIPTPTPTAPAWAPASDSTHTNTSTSMASAIPVRFDLGSEEDDLKI